MKIFSYGRQSISEDDINAVVDALRSDFLTCGPKISEFEQMICKYTGAKYCVAVNSATSGLHIAMMAAGVRDGDEVITSPMTFLASANCARYVGATVKFADIQKESANINASKINVTEKTKAIIPVHFAGQSCDMEAINAITSKQKRKIFIVEDAAHAIGSDYKNTKVGSCKYSDMTVFSFHPVKTITTGEGGAITTNNKLLYEKLLMYRSHGIVRDLSEMEKSDGRWYYEMRELGYNYRMTDIQAAIGISQLNRIEIFKKRRREIASLYKKLMQSDVRIDFLNEEAFSSACFHLCPVLINFEKLGVNKKEFFDRLYDVGLRLQVHYIPVHLQPYYKNLGYKAGDFPVAEAYYKQTISLPIYYELSDSDVLEIVDRFLKVLDQCINLD